MAIYVSDGPGVLVERKNDTKKEHWDADFACASAPTLVSISVLIDGVLFDRIFVQASHSWWTRAGGKLLPPNGLKPGSTLRIETTGACAMRIDWNE